MHKLIISLGLFFVPLFSFWITYDTQTFFDVTQERNDFVYIEDLVRRWIIDSWQFFRPDDKINRAELTKLVVSATLWPAFDKIEWKQSFPDVSKSQWYWAYVESAKYFRFLDWYPNWYFKPNKNVLRPEALKIIFNAMWLPYKEKMRWYRDVPDSAWYAKYANSAFEYDIYKWLTRKNWTLDMIFDANHEITRWEMAIYLSKALSTSKFYTKENYWK